MIFYEIKFTFTVFQTATTTERKAPSPLILSTQSSELKDDNLDLSDNDCPKIDPLTNDVSDEAINLEQSCSNTVIDLEEQGDDTKLVCNQSLGESLNRKYN